MEKRMAARIALNDATLADFGLGSMAYLKKVKAKEFAEFFPEDAQIDGDVTLWALVSADGNPLIVADSREAALANAFENDLEMVKLQ
ncbi:MAG: DUF1150 family protein [Rhodobacteraceae bacterium]|nr:DUF1150 family protein [Paracoccaceae bacterium]